MGARGTTTRACTDEEDDDMKVYGPIGPVRREGGPGKERREKDAALLCFFPFFALFFF